MYLRSSAYANVVAEHIRAAETFNRALTFRTYRGLQFIVSGLNLANEVFGVYNGSPTYPIQREYYKPSYEFGLRYSFSGEK